MLERIGNFIPLHEVLAEILDDIEHKRLCFACHDGDMYFQRGDSVLEQKFWDRAKKTDGGWHGATDQLPIGPYRVDAIFDCGGEAVVIELDGKAYHGDWEADHRRDKYLVQYVSAVIRIPFAAMWYQSEAAFKVIGEWFPRLKKAEPITVLSVDDLREELRQVEEEGHYFPGEFLQEVEQMYHVYAIFNDLAYVGSPKNFTNEWGKPQTISMQRGKTAPWVIDRIYEKSECGKGLKSIRARAA